MAFLDSAPRVGKRVRIDLPDLFRPAVGEPDAEGVASLRLLIDGEWIPSSSKDTFDVASPIDGGLIARAPSAQKPDLEAAIGAARRARSSFRSLSATARLRICEDAAEILHEDLDHFVAAIVADLGKTPVQARSEAGATAERLELVREEVRKIFGEYLPGDWIGDAVGKTGIVMREPVGTVAAIGPFNYPLFLAASKIIPAIAAGNTVVAKAPSDDPIALLMFARVLEEAGLPPGVLNVITGSGAEIGEPLAAHDDISMISFTGSSSAGRRIAASAGPKPLHLELGGNAAAIVLADADLEQAIDKTLLGAFKNAGQRCDAISRVLVQQDVYEPFVDKALKQARGWTVGDPRADGVDVGPLVHARAAAAVNALVQDAVDKGAELLLGGEAEAAYHQPTFLAGVPWRRTSCGRRPSGR